MDSAILERVKEIVDSAGDKDIYVNDLCFERCLGGYTCLYKGEVLLRIVYSRQDVIDSIYDELLENGENIESEND